MIRPLGRGDAETFIVLRREALDRHPEAFAASPEDDRASDPSFVTARLTDQSSAITFGAFDSALIGTVGLVREPERKRNHRAQLWGLYVRPEQRRNGVARALVGAAITAARDWPGVVQLHLSVASSATAAERLYLELGFTVWGTEPRALGIAGAFVDEKHMLLRLA